VFDPFRHRRTTELLEEHDQLRLDFAGHPQQEQVAREI
jgi:hypothetical protein